MLAKICNALSTWAGTSLTLNADCFSVVNTLLWITTLLAGFGTILFYFLQWRAMQDAIKAQNLAWLIQYLQSKDVRDAREFVFGVLKKKGPEQKWLEDDKKIAATACAAYGVAGVYIITKRIDPAPILYDWGPSIIELCEVCKDFIAERRRELGPRYWEALIEINERAKKASRTT